MAEKQEEEEKRGQWQTVLHFMQTQKVKQLLLYPLIIL